MSRERTSADVANTSQGVSNDGGKSTTSKGEIHVLDENDVRGRVSANWINEVHQCHFETSSTQLLSQIDQTSMLVCIRVTDEDYDGLVRHIWDTYPHIQVLLLLDRHAFTAVDRPCDEVLQEPFGKEALQETVRRLFARGLYGLKLREYYQLTSYLAGLEDKETDQPIERLQQQIERAKSDIQTISRAFDHTDFESVLQSHRERERLNGAPSMDAEAEARSKYKPAKCPNCGLAWDVAHGGRLGRGYERVAALVWRCNDCGEVLKLSPGEYDRIL